VLSRVYALSRVNVLSQVNVLSWVQAPAPEQNAAAGKYAKAYRADEKKAQNSF
jgi:hypothetical protein